MNHVKSFAVFDAAGNAHQIHVFKQVLKLGSNGKTREIEGETFLRTQDGDRVEEICPGVYHLPSFGGPIRVSGQVLRSAVHGTSRDVNPMRCGPCKK